MRAAVALLALVAAAPLATASRVTKTITVPCFGGYKGACVSEGAGA
jgi:hypothetical protein